MIITDATVKRYEIPYRTGSSWTPDGWKNRIGWLIILRAENGRIGVGEAAPMLYFSLEGLPEFPHHVRSAIEILPGNDVPTNFGSLPETMARVDKRQRGRANYIPPSLFFGIETALADLASQTDGVPMAEWLNPGAPSGIPVNAVIAGSPEDLDGVLREKMKKGYPAYKIKVGRDPLDIEVRKVARVREILGEDVAIRIDANQSWDFDEAVEALNRLKPFRIEYVEEPLKSLLLSNIPKLYERCGVDIALDESSRDFAPTRGLLESPAIRTVIIKPTLIGGISKSLELSRTLSELGKETVFTSLFESGIGLTACLHIAAASGGELPPCGFDTLGYLADSLIEEELTVRDGFMEIPPGVGLGVTAKEGLLPA